LKNEVAGMVLEGKKEQGKEFSGTIKKVCLESLCLGLED
jgi:hypothetical protein